MSALFDATSIAAIDRAKRALDLVDAPSPAIFSPAKAILWKADRIDPGKAQVERLFQDEYRARGWKPKSVNSVAIPASALLRHAVGLAIRQSYQTLVSGSGAELIETTVRGDQFIDVLRSRSVCGQLGMVTVGGLKGDVQLPRQTTASQAYWVTQGSSSGAPTESEGAFDSTPLVVKPDQLIAFATMSRLMQLQAPLMDHVLSNDILSAIASAIDYAVIQGAGSGGAPLGIVNASGINTITGTSMTYAMSVQALTDLTTANAVVNRQTLGWAATPTVAGLLAQRQKASGFSEFIWRGNADTGLVNGHPALATNNVPAATAIFGDWSQVLLLLWADEDAPVEIEVNQFGSGFASGDVQIRAIVDANVAIRHPSSFTVISGIT